MTQQVDLVIADVAELLTRYSFDLGSRPLDQWIDQWVEQYPLDWLAKAVVEALYQGRYKAISVWQILDFWRRRGKPLQHFNREFERIISGRSLQLLFPQSVPDPEPASLIHVPTSAQPMLVSAEVNGKGESRYRLRATEPQQNQQPSLLISASEVAQNELILPACAQSEPTTHSAIQPFKPSMQFKLTLPGEIGSRRSEIGPKSPIQQFVPLLDRSELHDKLRAIARSPDLTQPFDATSDAASESTLPEPTAAYPEEPQLVQTTQFAQPEATPAELPTELETPEQSALEAKLHLEDQVEP